MFPIRDNVPARRAPIVTYLLIGVNVVLFLRQAALPDPAQLEYLHVFGVVPRRLLQPAWAERVGFPPGAALSLFTSMFLHGGWFHLISNMWALWLFGDNVEDRLGRLRYILFYVLCGVVAMLAHVALNPASVVPAVGASGAIAGVMGAYLLYFPLARMVVMIPVFFYPLFFEVPAVVFLVLWILTQLVGGASARLAGAAGAGGVAFWAHVGGFFCGMILGARWRPRRRSLRRYREFDGG